MEEEKDCCRCGELAAEGCGTDEQRKPAEPRTSEEKQKMINRLKRVEGQVRGLQKMIAEDRYCIDILIQLSAAQAALQKLGFSVLERHTKSCIAKAVEEGHGSESIDELIKVLRQFYK
ncbi:DNA-binding FrmR family transcriptional regulator [Sporolactobacillus spathodeae]|uniref:DNA-binding FrmR family transcriptional regulator n=2 Tax=Sporolactobacillus spathodeae TaxID=1465502 RepID=A0ABS2Q9N6_9BACL|nr:DNA-binding FrmR family transcriptional regulator [Sporolactobacillus spathodeae]